MIFSKTNSAVRSGWLPGAVLLIFVLLTFFWQSFLPGFIQFNNDGPLGAQMAASARLPGAFTGTWASQNSIGSGGAFGLCITGIISWILGPLGFAKFFIPLALLILGLGALTFFKELHLSPPAVILGALATMLNSAFFSTACWGVASQQIGQGMDFFALALVVSLKPAMPTWQRVARIVLAGLAVGMNFNDALDIGALFSICVAAFIFYQALAIGDGAPAGRIVRGAGTVLLVTIFAVFIAAQGLVGNIQTQIRGVAGTQQDPKTKAEHWDFATLWSFPKTEVLSLFMPGLFGYRLIPMTADGGAPSRDGSDYWGSIGRAQAWDRYFAEGKQGSPPNGMQLRQVGGGNYAGVLVSLVALWTTLQSFRRTNSVFSQIERRLIWFWAGLIVVSLLLAFGRYAPFYQFVYALPYFSTIRSPTKFLYIFSFALVTLFAYGIHGLTGQYRETMIATASTATNRAKSGWSRAAAFDRRWIIGCIVTIAVSLLGWWIYAGSRRELEQYLDIVGPAAAGGSTSAEIADFSVRQPGWFIFYLTAGTAVMTLILSGVLGGKRAKWVGFLLGLVLVADLGRADLPWVIYWNYEYKYETRDLNPIIQFLAKKPYEQRVAILPSWFSSAFQVPPELVEAEQLFDNVYEIEWKQHLFLYYNLQTLDVVQMPRVPEDLAAYETALMPRTPDSLYRVVRRWELTNTRYLLGAAPWLQVLNQGLDPAQQRFKILKRFNISLKPGVPTFTQLTDVTAVADTNGTYALFEFTGALPRAKLYSTWQVNTNDQTTLTELTSKSFNPQETVLVANPISALPAGPSNQNQGTVEFSDYSPKHVALKTKAEIATILLFNDKYDPNWEVELDGRPTELLRCNFIMRGIYLPPGSHTIDFHFSIFTRPLYVSIAATVLGIVLIGVVLFWKEPSTPAPEAPAGPTPLKNPPKK